MPFELFIALRYLRRQAEAGVHLAHLRRVDPRRRRRRAWRWSIALALMTGLQRRAARSHRRLDGARLRLEGGRGRRRRLRSRKPRSSTTVPRVDRRRAGASWARRWSPPTAARRSSPSRASIRRSRPKVTDIDAIGRRRGSSRTLAAGRPTVSTASSSATTWPAARRVRRRHGDAADAAGHAVAARHDAAHAPLKVVGIFSLGLFEFDSSYGFVSLPVARAAARTRRGRTSSSCASTTSTRAPEVADDIPEQARARTT